MKLQTTTRRPDPSQFAEPLPPTLQDVLQEHGVEELVAHRTLAARFRAASEAVREARAALQQAGVHDAEAERAFAADPGAKLPASKAEKARERLERVQREHDVLARQMVRSADELVSAAGPHVGEAAARVAERVEQDAAEGRATLERALELFERRGPVAREAGWLTMAQTKGRVHAWRPTGAAPDEATRTLRLALAASDAETVKRKERRAQRALEEEVMRLQERGMTLGEARTQARKTVAASA